MWALAPFQQEGEAMTRYLWLLGISMFIGSSSFATKRDIEQDPGKNALIYDWSALGSGCRGGIKERKGNVTLAVTPHIPPGADRYRLRFALNKFRLESPVPKDQGPTNLEFARDCAIRVAVNPPAGKRIQNVEAYATYSLTKPLNTDMRILAGLTIGMDNLGMVRMDFTRSEKFSNLIKDLRLAPGPSQENQMPETKCGQAKLVGLDLLFYVNRPDNTAVVEMTLADNKVVDMMVDLEDCEGL